MRERIPKTFYYSPSSKEIAPVNSDTSHWNLYSGNNYGDRGLLKFMKTDQDTTYRRAM